MNVPVSGNSSVILASVPERRPRDLAPPDRTPCLLSIQIAVDTKHHQRLAPQSINERPLARVHYSTAWSPITPETNQNYLITECGQMHSLAIEILSINLRRIIIYVQIIIFIQFMSNRIHQPMRHSAFRKYTLSYIAQRPQHKDKCCGKPDSSSKLCPCCASALTLIAK
jgi:hypothetical protein